MIRITVSAPRVLAFKQLTCQLHSTTIHSIPKEDSPYEPASLFDALETEISASPYFSNLRSPTLADEASSTPSHKGFRSRPRSRGPQHPAIAYHHPNSHRQPHETHLSIFTQLFPNRQDYQPSPPPPRKPKTDREFELYYQEPPLQWETPIEPRETMSKGQNKELEAWKHVKKKFPVLGDQKPIFRPKYWGVEQKHLAMLTVRGTVTGLGMTDFERILPKGLHIPGKFWTILKIIPKLHPRTLAPTGTYYLLFPTSTNALIYRSEFHRLQHLYTSQPPFLSPPSTRPFTLCSPTSTKTSMEITVGPEEILRRFRPGYRANVFRHREYNMEGAKEPRVLVKVVLEGDQMTLGRLYMLMNLDAREHGVEWSIVRSWCRQGVAFSLEDANLAGRRKSVLSSPLPPASELDTLSPSESITEDNDYISNTPSSNNTIHDRAEAGENPLNIGSSQFLILFTGALEAQRFVRGWNGRQVIFRTGGAVRKVEMRVRVVMDVWDEEEGAIGSLPTKRNRGIYDVYHKKTVNRS